MCINIVNNIYIYVILMKQEYIYQSMMTCIGNKRKLINNIEDVIKEVKEIEKKDKLDIMDGFIGSGVVSRMLSYHSNKLITNDLEKYSHIMSNCYLNKPSKKNQIEINNIIDDINKMIEKKGLKSGVITKNYAPKDSENIKEGERCFYTNENGRRIDTIRQYIDGIDKKYRDYIMSALLIKSSIHCNTAGIFNGFYKSNGIGKWGGSGENALERIKGLIRLDNIIWNNECKINYKGYNEDINELLKKDEISDLDVIYLDPPYNKHPYGSNYFMLNTIIDNKVNDDISKESGIPKNWNRSNYNSKVKIKSTMKELLELCKKKTKYIILSYNNEGFISMNEWEELLKDYKYKKYEILYDAFKGSRNLNKRNKKVTEMIYLIY